MRRRVIRDLGDPIVIEEGRDRMKPDALGSYDERTLTVTISPDQDEPGKHVIVLHELLHLVDAQLLKAGVTRRRVDHRWIESAAPNLLALLVLSGFWRGVERKDLLAMMKRLPAPKRRSAA